LRESKEFEIVDYVALAFKHVATGKGEKPKLKATDGIKAVKNYDRDATPLAALDNLHPQEWVALRSEPSVDLLEVVQKAAAHLLKVGGVSD
jgi:hypothetical protein